LLKVAPGGWEWTLGRLNRRSRLGSTTVGLTALADRRLRTAIGPDVSAVVSTYPLASQALGRLRAAGHLDAPVITFLTDMSVHPLWIHPGVDLHLALHPIAARQASDLGAGDVRIVAPAVSPAFTPIASDRKRDELRQRFDLPAGRRLALVVAGSWGVGEIEHAVADIAATGLVTPIVACGRNAALHARIAKAGCGIPLGWISDMPALISSCNVVVQNAGGLTSLEAIAAGVPVLTYRCLAGHGRTNADALDRAGWAPWIRERRDLPAALCAAFSADVNRDPFTGTDVADAVIAALPADLVRRERVAA
jgi:UDP-N-acetylglucosamine:LPS N-acetylglucosamine transferase